MEMSHRWLSATVAPSLGIIWAACVIDGGAPGLAVHLYGRILGRRQLRNRAQLALALMQVITDWALH